LLWLLPADQPTQRQASQDEGQGGRAAAKKRAAPESLDAQMPGGAHGSGGGSGAESCATKL